jgi:bacterioferritin
LNLRNELTAINQYWLHYRFLRNWGLLDMAKIWRKESIEEMNHADRITDRIIFLDGVVDYYLRKAIEESYAPRLDCSKTAWQ